LAKSNIEQRLEKAGAGEVLFDRFSRGRYATDASHYQMMPQGVVVPRTMEQARTAVQIAVDENVPVTARGGGTSQCGQTINSGLIVDCSKHLNRIIDLDVAGRRCSVEPGIVLEELNRQLKPHGLWFPVDVSTGSRATLGGMTGNNSCGGRSLRYGTTRDNVISVDAMLADGRQARFGGVHSDLSDLSQDDPLKPIFQHLLEIGRRDADEVAARVPTVQRRVGGYNVDALVPPANSQTPVNLAHLLVGSEGTLAFTTAIELKLWPVMGRRGVGVCHFGSFFRAMDAAQHIVKLKPIAVELVDDTMIGLARKISIFEPTLRAAVRGEPAALLLVEFAEDDAENAARVKQLSDLMADLGFAWDKTGDSFGGVVEVFDPNLQQALTELRTSGLNIMMSMRDARKPVSFVEDCAVPLEHLAEYTARLSDVFARHGTRGTWYAHASVGCLHVRPVLNLRLDKDVEAMRAIAEEAFEMVRAYKGSHSGEHGDGLVRSEFHEKMFGERLARTFEEIKHTFDPKQLFNPGKIVQAPKFDNRDLFRLHPAYTTMDFKPVLDWSDYPGAPGGVMGAAEMCNNNGACRKLQAGAMCPSYRVTRNERDVTRGRANTLRLALSGQLGADAMHSEPLAEAMKFCVSCKACRRECPTGVDMARFNIEAKAARAARLGISMSDRLVAYLPHYAPIARRMPWLFNARNALPGARWLSERMLKISASRDLPRWRKDIFSADPDGFVAAKDAPEVVVWADTFNSYFDREIIDDAISVLAAAGYRVQLARPGDGSDRPLCCGRTFLSAGLVDKAREELQRSIGVLEAFARRGVPIIGLEPSCLLTFRDEALHLGLGEVAELVSQRALLFEEFLALETEAGRFKLDLASVAGKALLHGHCHQKSFGAMNAITATLKLVPQLDVEVIESSCCGMAGAFGYQAETVEVSRAMGELSLLPAVREAQPNALIVADGTSCRHQIEDGTGRRALHVAQVLAMSARAAGTSRQSA